MNIFLHNTLTGTKEEFSPITPGQVSMYHCGPTVYGEQHIGNLSMFVFTDVLRRALEHSGYGVKQVINITDFGHLVSDNDEGEDKMTKGLKAEGLTISMENMKTLATKYADIFLSDIKLLNVKTLDTQFPYASEYVDDQKKLIERLEEKGFTYNTSDGVYFDTSKFPDYGKLGNINAGDESRITENTEKKNPKDFALWKFSNDLGWNSKWGMGFPGWHIECTAMTFALLGEQIDIHTGGIEHIAVHHNNEIAQAEAASGKSPFSKFWLHREHIRIEDTKIAKSTGNVVYLSDLIKNNIHPLSYRYWLLMGKYNTPTNFTWDAVQGAQNALEKIVMNYITISNESTNSLAGFAHFSEKNTADELIDSFESAIADNLNTPIAISLLQEAETREEIEKMDGMLGLNIAGLAEHMQTIPDNILELQKQRDAARRSEDWKLSDELRDKIEHLGFTIKDTSDGTLILRSLSSLIK